MSRARFRTCVLSSNRQRGLWERYLPVACCESREIHKCSQVLSLKAGRFDLLNFPQPTPNSQTKIGPLARFQCCCCFVATNLSTGIPQSFHPLFLFCIFSAVPSCKVAESGFGEENKGDLAMIRLMLVTIIASHCTNDNLLSECQVRLADRRRTMVRAGNGVQHEP